MARRDVIVSLYPSWLRLVLLVVVSLVFLASQHGLVSGSKYSWMWYDRFDEIDDHMMTVDPDNCRAKSREDLVLRPDVVNQLPVYNRLKNRIWYKNRTSLIHLHNMALNRAFFYSFILQRQNDTKSFHIQPNWLYMYMSAVADVNANPDTINGSAIYFDTSTHYPNWYETVPFNTTLKLFGPKAWQHDDTKDQGNFLREPTKRVANVRDLGADGNYTNPTFKMNPWYRKWLPDTRGDMDSVTKFTYYVGIKKSNVTGKFEKDEFEQFNFFGPSSPSAEERDERALPVVWTQPYFDCGRYNNWVLSAVSPVVDYMPRYSNWTHLRRQRFVAVVVMDIFFKKIDFNACNVGTGNPGPSYVSGIQRCRRTTNCKHKTGQGWKRGGYTCPCGAGNRYPWGEPPPWDGADIEQATDDEYYNSFVCSPSDFLQVLPNLDQTEGGGISGGQVNSGSQDIASMLVSPEFRTRNLRWAVNETRMPDDYRSKYSDVRDRDVRSKYSDVRDVLHDLQRASVQQDGFPANRNPPVETPYGMHVDTEASHDRKPIPKDQVEATLNRRAQKAKVERSRQKVTRPKEKGQKPEPLGASSRRKREVRFDEKAFDRMMRIFRQKDTITGENCYKTAPHNLVMPGDVSYGVTSQFEMEARTALRLAHFLSLHLQNTDPDENFGNMRGGGRLHTEHMFGEVVANVLGNHRIATSGVYFDSYQFENQDGSVRELFGPWSYRKDGVVNVIDTAGLNSRYVDQDWYRTAKERWATNQSGLKVYKMQAFIRSDSAGSSSIKHEHYPLRYRAPHYESGFWTTPYFRCDGKVDAWVITYVVPFFGFDTFKRRLKFKGVVTVDVPLDQLEINPCPMPFGVSNAFKNTAHCDSFSTQCSPIAGYPFTRGAYSCKCSEGFEYPHRDGREWYEGSLVESEWEKQRQGIKSSRFHLLYCRVSGSAKLQAVSVSLFLVALVISIVTTRQSR